MRWILTFLAGILIGAGGLFVFLRQRPDPARMERNRHATFLAVVLRALYQQTNDSRLLLWRELLPHRVKRCQCRSHIGLVQLFKLQSQDLLPHPRHPLLGGDKLLAKVGQLRRISCKPVGRRPVPRGLSVQRLELRT